MSGESPLVYLFSSDGYEVAVINGATTPANTRGILVAGSDGTNTRFILMDGSSRQIVAGAGTAGTSVGGVLSVQGVSGGTAIPISGTVTANAGTGNFAVVQATASNLNAAVVGLGSAGTPSGGVLTVQGVSGGTAIPVTSSSSDGTATGTLGSLNASVQITTAGYASVGMQLAAGTLVGTLVAETSFDAGTTWNPTVFNNASTSNNTSTIVFGSSNTATAATLIGAGGTGLIRVRVSAYTSGTANVTLRASEVRDPSTLNGGPAAGSLPPTISQVGGSVTTSSPTYTNATLNALSLTTAGALRIDGSAVTQPVIINDTTATGALGALNAAVQISTAGYNTAGFQLAAGTLIGTIIPEVSFDSGTTWTATYFDTPTSGKVSTIVFGSSNTATAATIVGVGGSGLSRVRVSAYTSGTANITVRSTTRTDPSVLFAGPIAVAGPPSTAQVGGAVTTASPTYTTGTLNNLSLNTSGGLRVDGSAVTQPVSIASAVTVAQANAANLNATVTGTITSNQGTANTLANAWSTKITDATNGPVAVKAASTAAVATDSSLVIGFSPNSPLPTGSNTIGALTANQSVNLNQVGGTAVVTGGVAGTQGVGGLAASGSVPSGNPVLVAGSDGTDVRTLSTDSTGRLSTKAICSTGTNTTVASATSSTTLLAVNTNRIGATIYNASTAILYVKFSATASPSSYTLQIAANGYFEVPYGYTGVINGIWASANGNAQITELT